MSFEDIDTPVSDAELSGQDVADPVVAPDDPAATVDPVEPEPKADVAEAEDPAPERNPVIPRARFDEVNTKLHAERERAEAAERRLAEMMQTQQVAQQSAPATADIDAMEVKFFDAMMEGNRDEAVKIRAQINAEISSRAESAANERMARQLSERETKSALESVGAKAMEQYPFLDHQSDAANAEAIGEVVEWRDFYQSKGDPIHVALGKAVAKVGPGYSTPAQTAAAILPVDSRKKAALVRNAADAAAQPPAQVAGIGNRAAPPNPKVETQQDWEKLSDADRDSMLM